MKFYLKLAIVFLVVFSITFYSGASELTEKQIVACTILGEARGEGKIGMTAVAAVIQQRAKERKLSPQKVCLQKLQFSCNNKGVQSKLLHSPQAEYGLMLAEKVINKQIDCSIVGFSNHYHTKNVKPYWSKGKKPKKVIGNHLFFKL